MQKHVDLAKPLRNRGLCCTDRRNPPGVQIKCEWVAHSTLSLCQVCWPALTLHLRICLFPWKQCAVSVEVNRTSITQPTAKAAHSQKQSQLGKLFTQKKKKTSGESLRWPPSSDLSIIKAAAAESRPLSWWKLPTHYSCTFADKLLASCRILRTGLTRTPTTRQGKGYTNTAVLNTCTHEKCNQPRRARGNALSIPSAHHWRFHFLIPSSLQMRRRLSVDLPCLNSSHNCLCCVLGKAGVQSKYFHAERGSGIARKSAHVIWT